MDSDTEIVSLADKNKIMRFLLPIVLFTSTISFSQAPQIQWQKSFGGSAQDVSHSVQQTSDGGYIVSGFSQGNDGDITGNHGSLDYWIIKLDGTGNLSWQKSFGGSFEEQANSIQETSDGGFIIAGFSTSNDGDVSGNNGNADFWIVKIDSSGNILWQKSLGGAGGEIAYSIQQTSDGGYIAAGYSYSNDGDVSGNHGGADYWIVKLDGMGNLTWQKTLGGYYDDIATSIQQTTDGGYIVTGFSGSNDGDITDSRGGFDYWVVKLNASGGIRWQKSLGSSVVDHANAIEQTADGGYIVAGFTSGNDSDVTGNHGFSDYWVVKLSIIGVIEWQKSLGGSDDDVACSIQQTSDGQYIVAGRSKSADGDVSGNRGSYDSWVVKLNSSGNIVWQKAMGGSSDDTAFSIQQTTDNGFIVSGGSWSTDGDVTFNHGFADDYWIVKLDATGNLIGLQQAPFTLYPNPTEGTLYVEVAHHLAVHYRITDFNGREIQSGELTHPNNGIDIQQLNTGVYLMEIDGSNPMRFVKE